MEMYGAEVTTPVLLIIIPMSRAAKRFNWVYSSPISLLLDRSAIKYSILMLLYFLDIQL